MERGDEGLAFLLRYENVAWYENGTVRILDRRVYPGTVKFVICRDYREVAEAIRDMVTQSAGPYMAAAMGIALAAHQCRDLGAEAQLDYLKEAAHVLSRARPTTVSRMERITSGCLGAVEAALKRGENPCEAVAAHALGITERRYRKVGNMAKYLVDQFPAHGTVMTQCFGETIVGLMLKEARARNVEIRLLCPETRPYFQGARLTASVACDMGFDVTVITDNMPACVMQKERVDLFTSAADAICLDGHIVNKVGTFQIAIAANYLGVPYYVTGIPDSGHPTVDTVTIEQRDPTFVLQAMGVRTAMDGVKGCYPSFDVTPPALVRGVVTDWGVYSPYELDRYLKEHPIDPCEMVI